MTDERGVMSTPMTPRYGYTKRRSLLHMSVALGFVELLEYPFDFIERESAPDSRGRCIEHGKGGAMLMAYIIRLCNILDYLVSQY